MNAFKTFIIAMIAAVVFTAPAQAQDKSQWGSMTETSCGQVFQCLTAEDVKTLSGKTLKYRHIRFPDFGYVYLVLKEGGKFEGRNDKGPVSGSWEVKDNVISLKTDTWGDFSLLFYRIGDQLFAAPKTTTGGGWFFPVAVI